MNVRHPGDRRQPSRILLLLWLAAAVGGCAVLSLGENLPRAIATCVQARAHTSQITLTPMGFRAVNPKTLNTAAMVREQAAQPGFLTMP